jgi:hypothetical protein
MLKSKKTMKSKKLKKEKTRKKTSQGKALSIKYCPTNATLADLLTKPLTKANIRKLCKMIKSIIGQQECVGANNNNRANNNTVPVQYGTGTGTNNHNTGTVIGSGFGTGNKK